MTEKKKRSGLIYSLRSLVGGGNAFTNIKSVEIDRLQRDYLLDGIENAVTLLGIQRIDSSRNEGLRDSAVTALEHSQQLVQVLEKLAGLEQRGEANNNEFTNSAQAYADLCEVIYLGMRLEDLPRLSNQNYPLFLHLNGEGSCVRLKGSPAGDQRMRLDVDDYNTMYNAEINKPGLFTLSLATINTVDSYTLITVLNTVSLAFITNRDITYTNPQQLQSVRLVTPSPHRGVILGR